MDNFGNKTLRLTSRKIKIFLLGFSEADNSQNRGEKIINEIIEEFYTKPIKAIPVFRLKKLTMCWVRLKK